jgi:hypothetical protein
MLLLELDFTLLMKNFSVVLDVAKPSLVKRNNLEQLVSQLQSFLYITLYITQA